MPLAEGDGRKNISSRMSVGTLALHAGLWPELKDLDAYGEIIRTISKDNAEVGLAIQTAFIQACKKADIPLPRKHRPVGQGRVKPLARLPPSWQRPLGRSRSRLTAPGAP